MKYMLAIHADESRWGTASPEEIGGWMAAYQRFTDAATEAGVMSAGDGLQPSSTATTVRVRDGETLLTDGPFAETARAQQLVEGRRRLGVQHQQHRRVRRVGEGHWLRRVAVVAEGRVERSVGVVARNEHALVVGRLSAGRPDHDAPA